MKRPVTRSDYILRDADEEYICDTVNSPSTILESDAHLDEIAACVNIIPELIPVMERALKQLIELTPKRDHHSLAYLAVAVQMAKACIK